MAPEPVPAAENIVAPHVHGELRFVLVGWLAPGEYHVHTICVEQGTCEPVYAMRPAAEVRTDVC